MGKGLLSDLRIYGGWSDDKQYTAHSIYSLTALYLDYNIRSLTADSAQNIYSLTAQYLDYRKYSPQNL